MELWGSSVQLVNVSHEGGPPNTLPQPVFISLSLCFLVHTQLHRSLFPTTWRPPRLPRLPNSDQNYSFPVMERWPSVDWPSRGPAFNSQCPHGGPQVSVSLILEDLMSSSDLLRHHVCGVHRHTCRQNTYTHRKQQSKLVKERREKVLTWWIHCIMSFVNLEILIYLLNYMYECFACMCAYVYLETRVMDGCKQPCEY